jgi:phospholipase C
MRLIAAHEGQSEITLLVRANAYRSDGPWPLRIGRGRRVVREWDLIASHHWYDFTVIGDQCERRFAGRMENGEPGFSDPAV